MKSVRLFLVGLTATAGLGLVSCGGDGALESKSDATSIVVERPGGGTATSEVSDKVSSSLVDPLSWRVGADYGAVRVTVDGVSLPVAPDDVTIEFGGRSELMVSAGGCEVLPESLVVSSGEINVARGTDSVEREQCVAEPPTTFDAVERVFAATPRVQGGGATLEFVGDGVELVVETADEGALILIEEGESFRGSSTSVDGLDPASVVLSAPAYFVTEVDLSTCQLFGGMSEVDGGLFSRVSERTEIDPCPDASESDRAAMVFFAEGGFIERDGDSVRITNTRGELTFVPAE